MKDDTDLAPNIRYSPASGSIMLNVDFIKLPEPFEYLKTTFAAKSEFHVTLLNPRKLAAEYLPHDTSAEERIIMQAQRLLAQVPVQFSDFTNNFYFCKKDALQSIIAPVKVTGLVELYAGLRQNIPELAELPNAAPHVTLYVHGNSYGISVPNQEKLAARCTPLVAKIAEQLRQELKS